MIDQNIIIVAVVLTIIELILRLKKTEINYSLLDNFILILGKLTNLLPNKSKEGKHQIISGVVKKVFNEKKVLNTFTDIFNLIKKK